MDQITIEAARQGDRAAQAILLRGLQDVWFRFCLGLLGGSEEAQDAVQETAFRFLRDLPHFRSESSISTWSLGIALNITREMRRKRRAAKPIEAAEQQSARAFQSWEAADKGALEREAADVLRSNLHLLPERQREALLLRYFEELSIEDAAKAMGCAQGTVKATVHQALRTLKDKLKALA